MYHNDPEIGVRVHDKNLLLYDMTAPDARIDPRIDLEAAVDLAWSQLPPEKRTYLMDIPTVLLAYRNAKGISEDPVTTALFPYLVTDHDCDIDLIYQISQNGLPQPLKVKVEDGEPKLIEGECYISAIVGMRLVMPERFAELFGEGVEVYVYQ